jgi:hypothetical protein
MFLSLSYSQRNRYCRRSPPPSKPIKKPVKRSYPVENRPPATKMSPTMKRDDVLAIVAAHREQLQKMGVKSLNLFGSVARDQAHADSDVDFLLEIRRSYSVKIFLIRVR